MMNTKNIPIEQEGLKLVYTDNEGKVKEFHLNKSKMIIGRSENCDIVIPHKNLSHYHAFLTVDSNLNCLIIDLKSENGLFINDSKMTQGFFTQGDRLKLGTFEFHVESLFSKESIAIVDTQSEIISGEGFNDDIDFDEDQSYLNLPMIDGEYCNIEFQDTKNSFITGDPLTNIISINELITSKDDELYDQEKDIKEIIKAEFNDMAISVNIFSNESLISSDTYPITNGKISFSGKAKKNDRIHINFFSKKESFEVIDVADGKINVKDFGEYQLRSVPLDDSLPPLFSNNGTLELTNQYGVILEYKTITIFLKLIPMPPELRNAPFWERDPEFYKKVGGFLSLGLLFFLTSFFVNLEEPKKEEVTIIYKRPKAFKEAPLLNAKTAEVKMDNPENLKPNKVKTQKTNQVAKKSKVEPQTKKKTNLNKNKVAKKAKRKSNVKIKKSIAKVKTYKLNMKSSLNNLFAKTGDLSKVKVNNTNNSDSPIKATNIGSTGDVNLKKGSLNSFSGTVGKKGLVGSIAASGAKGLVDRKGVASSFIETKTVVLGSIDPELLRKILRKYLPQFRHCYQQELEFNSEKIQGVVDLDFRISENGKVSRADVKSKNRSFSKSGTECMGRVLSMIQFPKPKGGGVVDVRQPLNFYSEQS